MIKIVHRIYEKNVGSEYPVVEHVFYGKDEEEARSYFDAHAKADKFFSGCEGEGRFGDIECWAETRVAEVSDAAAENLRSTK